MSDMKSVCNQFCKEFMSDILHITSRSEDDDILPLQKYLLEGRGWILLQVIHDKGVQTLTGCRDFANLLVSLFPWCIQFPLNLSSSHSIDVTQQPDIPPLSDCFKYILKSGQVKHGQARNQSVPATRLFGLTQREAGSRQSDRESSDGKRRMSKKRNNGDKDDTDSDDESVEPKAERSKGKLRKKYKYANLRGTNMSHSQQKLDSESDDDDIESLLKSMNNEGDSIISGFELCVIILELLQDLAMSDLKESTSGKMISPTILPNLLKYLLTFDKQSGVENISDKSLKEGYLIIKRLLVRVVLVCSGITAIQPNGINILHVHKVITHVLKSTVCQELLQPSYDNQLEVFQNLRNEIYLVSDSVIGIILCLTVMFENLPFNLSFIKTSLNIIEEFDEHKGFLVLDQCVLFYDWLKFLSSDAQNITPLTLDDPIKIFGSFLNTMKIVRVNYVHSMKCVKRKHQQCSYSQYFDHHHDILGVSQSSKKEERKDSLNLSQRRPSQSQTTSQTICLISSCTQFLLDLLNKVTTKATRLDLLKVIYSSGVCCCMSLVGVVSSFVSGIEKFSPAVRTFAIDIFNKIILEHFSGGIAVFQGNSAHGMTCFHCEPNNFVCAVTASPLKSEVACLDIKRIDSGIESSDVNRDSKISALGRVSKWRPLSLLKSLLFSDNESLAVSIAKHLMVLAIKGNPYLKAELYFSLYSHSLSSVQSNGNAGSQKLSKSVQVHCLSALPYLLQANCVTKVFLSKKGVSTLCELLEDKILRAPVLRIFEALVVLDGYKLEEETASFSDQCPCPYNGGRVIDAFIHELSTRSFSDTDMYHDDSERSTRGRIRKDSVVISKFSLPVLVDLWQTCTKLCLHSHTFVSQFNELQCFEKSEALLLETLDIIISPDLIGQLKSQGSIEGEDSGWEGEQSIDLELEDQMGFYQRISLFESLMVVIGAGHKFHRAQKCGQLKTWHKLKDHFTHAERLDSTKLRTILDAVMNAAMPQFVSLMQFSYSRNIALVHIRDDDIYDEDEVRHLLQSASDDDDIYTEVGYDADCEETHLEDHNKEKRHKCDKLRSPYKIYFPTTFGLLFDLLVLVNKQEHKESVVASVLYKILQNIKMDNNLTKSLCSQDIMSVILGENGLSEHLLKYNTEGGVSESLLGLIEQLGPHKIKSHDLQKLLQLFQHSDTPIEKLLSVFLTVVEKSDVVSHHSVTFPAQRCKKSHNPHDDFLESGTFEKPGISGAVPLLKTMSHMLMNVVKPDKSEKSHEPMYQEVWDICALQHGLKDTVVWPPMQIGVTVAIWACLEKGLNSECLQKVPVYDVETGNLSGACFTAETERSSVSECLHMVSIGTKEKLLEMWAEVNSGSLILRLTSEVNESGVVVQESKLVGVLSLDKWHHVVLSYKEGFEGSTVMGNINLVIDGWQSHSLILDYPHSSIRTRHRSSTLQPQICLGHTLENTQISQHGQWHLGQMMLFKGLVLTKEICFHVYTLGPNCKSILKCDSTKEFTIYAPHLHKNTIVHSRIPYDVLTGLRKSNLSDLRHNLLLSYQPREVKVMMEFPPVSKTTTNQIPSHTGYAPDTLLTQVPKPVTPVCQGQINMDANTSLEMAIEESGGIAAILFLVAKVYERCPESMDTLEAERIQSEVLKVLMSVMHHSSQLHEEYLNIGGHALLCKVLTSSRSVPGQLTLKVLMDAATTESLYRFTPESNEMILKQKTDAVIRDISIIEQLILHWLIWERCSTNVTELLYAGLGCLIQEGHRYQNYNVKQYQAINIVNRIFKIYQERIQEGFPSLPVPVGSSVVNIIQNMSGSPPDYHLIIEICDFLLLVHPAANTYINHSRSQFYFTLPCQNPPSPLSKLKTGSGLVTSSPVKSTSIANRVVRKIRKNFSDSFLGDGSASRYPDMEILDYKQLLVSSDKHDLKTNNKTPKKVQIERKTTDVVEPNKHIPDTDNKQVVESTDSSDKDLTVTVDKREITDPILAASADIRVSTQIPDNFESLYKTAISCEDGEGIKFSVSDDSVKADCDDDNDKDSKDTGDSCKDAKLGSNVVVDKRSEGSGDNSDSEDMNGDETDETEGASYTREDLSINFDEDNAEMLKLEKGLTALCVGLLRLLSSIVLTMPDKMVSKTFRKSIISAQTFIVLAQNSSSEVRDAVIKVMSAYLERCNQQTLDEFRKMEGFHLLSAQLFQYPTHQDQMEAACSILLKRPFRIDDGFQPDENLEDLTRIQQGVIPVILTLLSNSLCDLALCHNSILFCTKLFENSDEVATVMVDQGVIEVVASMLQKLINSGTRDTDVEGMDENEILLSDLLEFYKVIAIREFSSSDMIHYQNFEDIIWLLQDMEQTEIETRGIESKNVQTIRTFVQHTLSAILDFIEKTSEDFSHQSSLGFFSKPLTVSRGHSQYAHSQSSFPSLPTRKNLSLSPQHFLSGSFGRLPFHKKSGGYFVQSDNPYTDGSANSGSGDSDSSQESWSLGSSLSSHISASKQSFGLTKSVDVTHGRQSKGNTLIQTVLSLGKWKKLCTAPISQGELIERLKKMISFTVDTSVYAERKINTERRVVLLLDMGSHSPNGERNYLRKLFNFSYRAFEVTLPQDKNVYHKKTKNVIMWGAKDILRVQFSRLLGFMLSNKVEFEQRIYALSFMLGEPRGLEVLRMLLQSSQELGSDLAYFAYDLLTQGKSWLSRQQNEDGAKLINCISSAGLDVYSPSKRAEQTEQERVKERKNIIDTRYDNHKKMWTERKRNSLQRIHQKYDKLATKVSDSAMEVTQSVTHLQFQERNKFVNYIKQKKTENIQVKKQWQDIVQNLSHERALWYDQNSYPQSWQLNPTEGPCRVRKRLQRGHLGILPKFLKKESQFKLASETVDPPLIYLFEDDHQMSDSAALIYQLHKNKKIRYTSTCRAVSPVGESKGELLIGEDSVFFVADEAITDANYTQVLLGNKDQLSMTWPFEDFLEIHKRWFELTDTAIEIFLTNGKTCLLAFKSTKERDEIFQHLLQLELPNRRDTGNLLDVLDKWQTHQITNFEYLTYLNKRAGRSFNDLMQYPIMPFILRDYTSPSIDLRDLSVYRDLSKPVSVQDPKNEQKFKNNYEVLKAEFDKFGREGITGLRVAPYHYGSHYSNSGSVLHFLVRLPPFTKMFLSFQDQSFDIPDRTFHNIHTSWRLSSAESNTDVKELIPEFFSSHEFLINNEGFEFGQRQSGEIVNNVVLPPWCDNNPRLFMLIHRQALESDYVSENISGWIDLVFGFKQRGEAAVRAINVFHPATYFGLDVSSVKNSLDRKAIQTMVRTYGQTPKQLFPYQHPRQLVDVPPFTTRVPSSSSTEAKLVSGLKWGSYLGSPNRTEPVVVWEETHDSQVACLVALPTGINGSAVFGISAQSCLLVQHSQDKQRNTSSGVAWAAILTWGQQDGLVRIINGTSKPALNFIQYNQSDEITCCVSVPDCRHVFFGGTSGVISIYNTKHNPAKESELQVFGHKKCLYGHEGAINSLVVCKPYSILVSASQDATCIIWDLNRLSYVRSIKGHKTGVEVLAVSETLGDIASASHYGMGCHLYLHTVNAEYVAMVTCEETINCLTYSTAAEGVSINVIAGGLSSGVIRMWSSWDLAPIRDLVHSKTIPNSPIISLTFTKDSQKLYASSADGCEFIPLDNKEFIPLDNKEFIPLDNKVFIPLDNKEFIPLDNKEFIPLDNKEFIPLDNKEFIPLDNKELILLDNKEFIPLDNKEFIPLDNKEFVPLDNKEFIPLDNKEFIPLDNKEFIPLDNKEFIPLDNKEFIQQGVDTIR
ncbi:hypothetical protein ACF0H5_002769 [Mactra antiquata]